MSQTLASPASFTLDDLKNALPDKYKKSLTPEVLNYIGQTLNEPDMLETYRNNLISYGHILADGKFKITQYIDAIKFCSFRLAGLSQKESYKRTFPDRMQGYYVRGASNKDISVYMSSYANSKLVTSIMQQAMMPVWLANISTVQQAIDVQVELMTTATSEKVRQEAANSLLTHLKRPEAAKVQLDITVPQSNVIDDLRAATEKLVAAQTEAIRNGTMNAQQIAHHRIIDAEEL